MSRTHPGARVNGCATTASLSPCGRWVGGEGTARVNYEVIAGRSLSLAVIVAGAIGLCLGLAAPGRAEPAGEQSLYWWQDEIRTAAFALGRARTGQVSQWPRISIPAGSLVLPLPRAVGPIRPDGQLSEEAWSKATRFPVGPVFDDWRQGPFHLQASACRDEQNVYLAVESPRDLTGFGGLSNRGELFAVGSQAFHVGPGGGLPAECVTSRDGRQVIELALPLAGEVAVSFPVECLRHKDGKLPAQAGSLGLDQLSGPDERRGDFRLPALWLEPIAVRLIPAETAVRLALLPGDATAKGLSVEVAEPGREPAKTQVALDEKADSGVRRYAWTGTAEGKAFAVEGFLYAEPVAEGIAAVRAIRGRAAAMGSATHSAAPQSQEIDALEADAARTAPQDRAAWRALFCRARELRARAHRALLDAPLLFVKQHPYFAGHIYDDFYTWHPGGGIYVLENAHQPGAESAAGGRVRAVIDPSTNETLGEGVYRDAELSWDARQIVFAHKGSPQGTTSIYAIGMDGRGLRRLTSSDEYSDVNPAYLPDGRIVFLSTRPRALVPCFNSGVATLHTMNADGSGIESISANNVNEFDPAVMPDGRVLYGRWEYVDKTALYMQSLWTMLPDGRMEEALFANNLARPTANLDGQPVPGADMVVASLTPHNGQAVGAIGMIDLGKGKNDLGAVSNFTPEYPVEMDQGLRTGPCDPFPLSAGDVLVSNNAIGAHGILELVDREGNRELVYCDPLISCYNPRLVKPRPAPPAVSPPGEAPAPGRFLVVDIYRGMQGVPRGTIKQLRIVEETARTSGIPPGGRWWNQAFLVSWQGAYIVKNFLGVVPVQEDGSAYFEAPPGRAIYFEALDAEGREIQRMRTFVQAVPGATRSCVGCHELKKSAPVRSGSAPAAMQGPPATPQPESWGSGYVDYPTMVQPVWDKYCVRCHGGAEGIGAGMDLSGGWTWAFNISYESLIKRRMTGFLNCNNASVHTSKVLPPRTVGSGASHLAEVLITKHPEMDRRDRDLVLAWMGTNSNYYGTWDYTQYATCDAILAVRGPLSRVMQEAGCTECHAAGHIGNDWVNLQTPEWSRILRAPMAKSNGGLGVGMCRKRKARAGYALVDQGVQPPDVLLPSLEPARDPSGEPQVVFASADDPHYQEMLAIIRHARAEALARPRVDMPGAEVVPGMCRMQYAVPVPPSPPALTVRLRPDYAVELSWQRTAETIGLQYELHRGPAADFAPAPDTQIGLTTAGCFIDLTPPAGKQHYALVVTSGKERSKPALASLEVPKAPAPEAPSGLTVRALPGELALTWQGPEMAGLRYNVFRAAAGSGDFRLINREPLVTLSYSDLCVQPGVKHAYVVRALDRRGQTSPPCAPVEGTPLAEIQEPVFAAQFDQGARAVLLGGRVVKGQLQAGARAAGGSLQVGPTGFATFEHLPEFDLTKALSLECWVRIEQESAMPVIVSCGAFNGQGWFLQRYGGGWRWHLAPVSCDGGRPAVGRWTHLVGTFDGQRACLYQDGQLAASVDCYPDRTAWQGPLVVGQYSSQAEPFQVQGAIAGLKLYRRVLRAPEVAEKAKTPPQ